MTHEDRNEGDPLKRRRHSTLTLEFVPLLLIPSLDGIVLPASQIGYCHDSCLDALPLFYLSYPTYFQNIFSMLFCKANLNFLRGVVCQIAICYRQTKYGGEGLGAARIFNGISINY